MMSTIHTPQPISHFLQSGPPTATSIASGPPAAAPAAQPLDILRALAQGNDPYSGAPLPALGPYQHPDTVRALFAAIASLERANAVPPSRGPATGPARTAPSRATSNSSSHPRDNAGKPWSPEDDTRLLAAFDAGETVATIAQAHARSRFAIEARLARFDRVPPPAGLRQPVTKLATVPTQTPPAQS